MRHKAKYKSSRRDPCRSQGLDISIPARFLIYLLVANRTCNSGKCFGGGKRGHVVAIAAMPICAWHARKRGTGPYEWH